MKVALIQAPLVWENPMANRNYFSAEISKLEADLFVLPEMFSTGFTMQPKPVAETMDGKTAQWMKETAKQSKAAIAGSIVIEESGRYFNRLLFATPSGEIYHYDKRHLFTLAGEDKAFSRGKSPLLVDYEGWKICFQICYDLRFPVFSRNVHNYDLLIYVANWPKPRINAWDALLKARAIENVSYVVGVNRIGQDASGHEYIGHSQAIDPLGNFVIAPLDGEDSAVAILDKQMLTETRSKFAFLDDRDHFTVTD